jgi:NAD-dependent SIR2 family protein deacetylase
MKQLKCEQCKWIGTPDEVETCMGKDNIEVCPTCGSLEVYPFKTI